MFFFFCILPNGGRSLMLFRSVEYLIWKKHVGFVSMSNLCKFYLVIVWLREGRVDEPWQEQFLMKLNLTLSKWHNALQKKRLSWLWWNDLSRSFCMVICSVFCFSECYATWDQNKLALHYTMQRYPPLSKKRSQLCSRNLKYNECLMKLTFYYDNISIMASRDVHRVT